METLRNANHGQALVELALIFPLFLFGIAVYFQVLILCRNAVVLQNAAWRAARQSALEEASPEAGALQSFAASLALSGRTRPPTIRQASDPVRPWRPFEGFSAIETAGHIVTVEISADLLPRPFLGRILPMAPLTFQAELLKEPPVPQEK